MSSLPSTSRQINPSALPLKNKDAASERDKTNRTNVIPLERGVTYIAKSMIKSQKKSLSLEDSEIPSPPCICQVEHTKRINCLFMWESSFENSHFPPANKCSSDRSYLGRSTAGRFLFFISPVNLKLLLRPGNSRE